MKLDELLWNFRSQLRLLAHFIRCLDDFSLHLPLGLIKNDAIIATELSCLSDYLSASVALSSPELDRFLVLRTELGFERAFELCSQDGDDGEAFCRVWDQAQADMSNGALATFDDLVAMVCKARRGWQANPRELLVVVVDGKRVESALVSTSWLLS